MRDHVKEELWTLANTVSNNRVSLFSAVSKPTFICAGAGEVLYHFVKINTPMIFYSMSSTVLLFICFMGSHISVYLWEHR